MQTATLRHTLLASATLLASFSPLTSATDITGAGATFPYPLYAKWAEAYKAKTGVGMNYQSIGSGGGIKQIQAKTVSFGASDKPLAPAELEKHGLTQFPTVVGAVVPVVNLEGVKPGELKLTPQLLTNIFFGKVNKWNDPALLQLNPGVKLPDARITVVHRSDGSGTTFNFVDYLSKVSPDWAKQVGAETSVKWPTGVGGKGNEGVAQYVQRIKGAIGYVEYAYVKQNKMIYTQLQNREGAFVAPSEESFKAAAANAEWSKTKDYFLILTNQPGKDSWPITAATFILMHKVQDNAAQGQEVLKFFNWAYNEGDKIALDLDYIPMPKNVKDGIRGAWKANIADTGKKPVL